MQLIRLVIGERGEVAMHTELVLRFGYGASVPWVTRVEEGVWRAIAGPDMTILRTSAPMHGEELTSVADFVVLAGETVSFVLTYRASHLEPPATVNVDEALRETETFWRDWVAKGKGIGRWSPAVTRSLITLRALIHRPTGGIIAAPTTSLPEHIGGGRNWDYRFCWLRDATFTLLALMNGGYAWEQPDQGIWEMRGPARHFTYSKIMAWVAFDRAIKDAERYNLSGPTDEWRAMRERIHRQV